MTTIGHHIHNGQTYGLIDLGRGAECAYTHCTEPTEPEPCAICHGAGYLLDQSYGAADVPEDWLPVQACDACELGRSINDETAAHRAQNDADAIDRRVYCGWFPGPHRGRGP